MEIDELGVTSDVEVIAMGGAVDPVSQTVVIRARLINPPKDILPGMSGVVRP